MNGQLVVHKSDDVKIIYQVDSEDDFFVTIKGVNHRIIKTVNKNELIDASEEEINKEIEYCDNYYRRVSSNNIRNSKKYILGTILHIDGDDSYLKKCMELYDALGIFAYGIRIDENKMNESIAKLLEQVTPDIIVVTGHDSYNSKGLVNLENYKNTKHFMDTVRTIRKYNSTCCIIAGACQSNFEALIASGSTFASSPKRINIHTFDPAVIAIKVATTSFMKVVDFNGVIKYIEDGREAFGGVETLGKMRMLL